MSEEKLNELKEKVAGLQEELKELAPEEIEKVFGGGATVGKCQIFVNVSSALLD